MSKHPVPSPMLPRAYAGVLGSLIGDLLGVPHEFKSAHELPPAHELVIVMPAAYPKTYPGVPYGCWSDDGSQLLCLLQTLHDHSGDLDLHAFGQQLLAWRHRNWHQSGGKVFDCGGTTRTALDRVRAGVPASVAGEDHDRSLGNGSLMRVLPAALMPAIWGRDHEQALTVAMMQSRVTHLHPVAQVCCAVYVQLALRWLAEPELPVAATVNQAFEAASRHPMIAPPSMQTALKKVQQFGAQEMPTGSGYVVNTLWTALWALERGTDYLSAVRLAISLGNDTDTSACVTGGLAGIRHGLASVPKAWWKQIRVPAESRRLLDELFNPPRVPA